MKNVSKWILCLLTLATVVGLSGAWTSAPREPAGQQGEPKAKKGGVQRLPSPKGRNKKYEGIKQALPTMKTSFVEAVALAEKETGGKSFEANVEIKEEKDGTKKVVVQVHLLVADKFSIATVNTETKKVTVASSKKDGAEGDEGDEGEGEEEEGG